MEFLIKIPKIVLFSNEFKRSCFRIGKLMKQSK